jgi:uncharacterized protein
MMKFLSIAGTVAMFLVGGGILVHGVPVLHHAVEGVVKTAGWWADPALNGGVGLIAGAVVLLAVTLFQRLRPQKKTTS